MASVVPIKRSKRKTREDINFEDTSARREGPDKKTWALQDLTFIKPMNDRQSEVFYEWNQGQNLSLLGSAGTGKSFLALYLLLRELLKKDSTYDKIVIVRSTVGSREIGFIPGTVEEKLSPYEDPYRMIFDKLFKYKKSYDNMKKAGLVEFHSTAYLRGTSFENSLIFFDEIQNTTYEEASTVSTRVGDNSKIIFAGDVKQNDLTRRKTDESGFKKLVEVMRNIEELSIVEFNKYDIVRSGWVKSWILAEESI